MNFTKAAHLCHVSQPALTKAVGLLEEELGSALFERQGRPLRLTELGQLLRGKFSEIWGITQDIRTRAEQFSNAQDAVFTLGAINSLSCERILTLTKQLKLCLPDYKIIIHHTAQSVILKDLREGKLQLAIVTDCLASDPRLTCDHLFTERYVLAVSPDGDLAQHASVPLEVLDNHSYIHRVHCDKSGEIQETLKARGVNPDIRLFTDQDEMARYFIANDQGASIMPVSSVGGGLASCEIDVNFERSIQLAASATREISPIADLARNSLREAGLIAISEHEVEAHDETRK